ncbi:forkhead box protein I1-B-like [Actinia tenebrosa]|uniref:Forkhead box protein I1-B-like n=1 Tax=Actinia tenebrosa TaxID=6105 RepID=A0A6P8HHU0_ACTTE|nr:forkhead box protein I1-B-like [Actinia tenebrosa]
MSTFSPLQAAHYGIPHGPGFHKSYITDLIPQQTGLYSRSPCACCFHEMFIQPYIIQDTPSQWSAHRPLYNQLCFPQESIVQDKDKQTKTQIEYKKPKLSYVELIAEAILSSKEKHLVLGDIYEAIIEKYPYFETKGSGWRNSIRHNLSLSDCFIKGERCPNGKGHFWEVNQECYGGNGEKGRPKPHKKKLGVRPKTKTDYIHNKLKQEKAISEEYSQLSLLSQLRFDDEIRQFEIARMKLTEVRRG